MSARIEQAKASPCSDALAEHASLVRDPAYAAEPAPAREAFEIALADCHLQRGDHRRASALAGHWTQNDIQKKKVTALAEAALGNRAAARSALEALAHDGSVPTEFFTASPEFRRYSEEDWFLEAALHLWARVDTQNLEGFAERLFGRREGFLPLHVAAADATRRPGEWAVWTGIVRSARIDRDAGQTLLFVEGVEVRSELRAVDRRVESTESTGVALPFGQWRMRTEPKYRADRIYEEVFVPTGRHFVLKYSGASEALVRMHAVTAVGRYGGREGTESHPVLGAIVVSERKAKQKTESE